MSVDSNTIKKRKKIVFRLEAPNANEVYLAGEFNDWSLKKHPMQKNDDGAWKKALLLPPGVYEYKFWVDGQWRQDPDNERCCRNSFGSINNIVQISMR